MSRTITQSDERSLRYTLLANGPCSSPFLNGLDIVVVVGALVLELGPTPHRRPLLRLPNPSPWPLLAAPQAEPVFSFEALASVAGFLDSLANIDNNNGSHEC